MRTSTFKQSATNRAPGGSRRAAVPILALAGTLAFAGCSSAGDASGEISGEPTAADTRAAETAATDDDPHDDTAGTDADEQAEAADDDTGGDEGADSAHGHDHPQDGGPPPAGIDEAADPTYPVGTRVVLSADHMPGMDGATGVVSGAFDTTAYAVTYTPTTGGEPVEEHRWVVHEELVDPGEAPLPEDAEVTLGAEHMAGMEGAEATIDYATDQTVYMVDVEGTDGSTMTNHKWLVESEMMRAE